MIESIAILVLIILFFSFFFSIAEASIFNVGDTKAEVLAKKKRPGGKELLYIRRNLSHVITSIVIVNNIVNIAGSILVGFVSAKIFDNDIVIGLVIGLLTFAVIVIGEIIPKHLGVTYAEVVACIISRPILLMTKLMFPITKIFESIAAPLKKDGVINKTTPEEEIKALSSTGSKRGEIETDENSMLQNVFRLNDLTVGKIMTPKNVLDSLSESAKLKDVKGKIVAMSHSRIPVYEGELDNLVGICFQKELLSALVNNKIKKDKYVRDFLRSTFTVGPNLKIDRLLQKFQKNKNHLAIVQDEFGTTLGVITLEDVLEQLVGEIVDETDTHENMRELAAADKKRNKK